MSAWGYVAGAAVMAAGGMLLVYVETPKRRVGRHEPNTPPLRAESGADATYAAELAVMRAEIVVEESGPQPAPNYYRSGEYPVVDPAEAQVWATQERIAEPAEPAPWTLTALEDEPTPLAPGPVPQLPEDLDPSTVGWNRAELLERIRRAELAMAKAKADPADEELAA